VPWGVGYEATRGDYTHARKAVALAQCTAVPISDVRGWAYRRMSAEPRPAQHGAGTLEADERIVQGAWKGRSDFVPCSLACSYWDPHNVQEVHFSAHDQGSMSRCRGLRQCHHEKARRDCRRWPGESGRALLTSWRSTGTKCARRPDAGRFSHSHHFISRQCSLATDATAKRVP
jgi:hypothetical protein